jgi:hypothetical protein
MAYARGVDRPGFHVAPGKWLKFRVKVSHFDY